MAEARHEMPSFRAVRTFLKVGTCSEMMFNVLDRAHEQPMQLEEHAAMPLAGGIRQYGYQCGMVWGAAFAAGAQAYRLHGAGPQAEAAAIRAAQQVVSSFRECNDSIDCRDLTEADMRKPMQVLRYLFNGRAVGCFRMAGRHAPVAFEDLQQAFADAAEAAPEPPVSCAALLARKMGASEEHAVMAAGLAGGIGLSGGGCGALGTAIWLEGIRAQEAGLDDKAMNARAEAVVERFLVCSDGEFECAAIVGRAFEDVDDHAGFLGEGGCSELIEALAAG